MQPIQSTGTGISGVNQDSVIKTTSGLSFETTPCYSSTLLVMWQALVIMIVEVEFLSPFIRLAFLRNIVCNRNLN